MSGNNEPYNQDSWEFNVGGREERLSKSTAESQVVAVVKNLLLPKESLFDARKSGFLEIPPEKRLSNFISWVNKSLKVEEKDGGMVFDENDIAVVSSGKDSTKDKTNVETEVIHKKLGILGYRHLSHDPISNTSSKEKVSPYISARSNLKHHMKRLLSYVKTLYPNGVTEEDLKKLVDSYK